MTRGQDYRFATSLYAQSARGGGLFPVDELLSEREKIQEQIAAIVGEKVRHWGLTVEAAKLIAETAWPVAFPMELGHALASLGRAKATGFRSTQP
ncbi:MAG: hypothetical protein Q6K14_09475 [Gloeomargarita sp. GMQP_bins_44]